MGEPGDNGKTASEQLNVFIRIDSEQREQTLTLQFPRTQETKVIKRTLKAASYKMLSQLISYGALCFNLNGAS